MSDPGAKYRAAYLVQPRLDIGPAIEEHFRRQAVGLVTNEVEGLQDLDFITVASLVEEQALQATTQVDEGVVAWRRCADCRGSPLSPHLREHKGRAGNRSHAPIQPHGGEDGVSNFLGCLSQFVQAHDGVDGSDRRSSHLRVRVRQNQTLSD